MGSRLACSGSWVDCESEPLKATAAPMALVKRVLDTDDAISEAPSHKTADCTWSSAALKAWICDGFAPSRGRVAADSVLLSVLKLSVPICWVGCPPALVEAWLAW